MASEKAHSTQQAIIILVEIITSSLDSGDLMIGLFLDLKKISNTRCLPRKLNGKFARL